MGFAGRRVAPLVAALALCVIASGCSGPQADLRLDERDGRPGLTLNGTVGAQQVTVRDGAPDLTMGDCDPGAGADQDVCAISQTIGGELFVMVFENPDVLAGGGTVEVQDSSCRGAECDAIEEHAVVDVQFGDGARQRATGGELRLRTIQPLVYYSGEVRLEFVDGRLSGEFDLVPRED